MKVAVVVPSLRDSARLETSLRAQVGVDYRLEVVRGVAPNGRARNDGIRRCPDADVFLFFDDDAVLTDPGTLATLLAGFDRDPAVGVTGLVRAVPADATPFQRRVAREVPLQSLDPPADWQVLTLPAVGKAWLPISTTACAVRRSVFDRIGLFDEQLVRGVDTDLFYRAALAGFSFAVAPRLTVGHYPPATLGGLLRRLFWTGYGHASEAIKHPQRRLGFKLWNPPFAVLYLLIRLALFPLHAVLGYAAVDGKLRPGFHPLRALASLAAAAGYSWRWIAGPRVAAGEAACYNPPAEANR